MFFNTSVKNQHLSMNSACTTIYSTKPSQLNFLRVACKTDELIYLLRCDVFFGRRSRLFSNSKVRYCWNSSLAIFHSDSSYNSKSLHSVFLRTVIK